MALVTAAQIRTLMPQLTGTGEDTTLDALSAQAEGALARWCAFPVADSGEYTLTTATYTEYLDGPDPLQARELRLPVRPAVAVTSIHQDPTEAYGAGSLVSSGDYVLLAERGRVMAKLGHVWLSGYRWLKVVYTAGYGTSGNAPGWVQQAVAYQVQRILEHASRRGVGSMTAAGVTRTDASASEAIDPRAARLMGPARLAERLVA